MKEITGAQAGLSGEDQIFIALKYIAEHGGSAEMKDLYPALEAHMEGNTLSEQGQDSLRNFINKVATKEGLVYPHDNSKPGWHITPKGMTRVQELHQHANLKSMRISRFYEEVLGANLRNVRNSWGSYDPITNRIYLRVWDDEIQSINGKEYIRVLGKVPRTKSSGYDERRTQLAMLENGAEGYGVLCTPKDGQTKQKKEIKSFDYNELLRFGEILETKDDYLIEVVTRVPLREIKRQRTSSTDLVSDIKYISSRKIEQTTKEALIDARVGQGRFRSEVLQMWGGKCAVTGITTLDAIRASHIKPWRDSDPNERLDPYNGLPFVANLDALFDSGLISFDAKGQLLISLELSENEVDLFSLQGLGLSKCPGQKTVEYLKFHNNKIFKG